MPAAVEVLYVSSVPDRAEFDRIKSMRRPGAQEVTYGMAESSFQFHTLLQQGLLRNDCRVHSVVGRPVSRRFYRGYFWRSRRGAPAERLTVDHVGMPLMRGLKQVWLAAAFVRRARAWEQRTRGASLRLAVIDGAYVTVMPGVLRALRGTGVVSVGIFGDLYSYMADVVDASSRRSGGVHALLRRVTRRSLSRVDGFVVLTEAMNGVINTGNRPHMVMEGLVDESLLRHDGPVVKAPEPTVAYLGALRRAYGLADLVDGFRAWDRSDARLLVFGQGEYAAELAEIAAEDPRIVAGGAIPLARVIPEERRAWLLVNPRPADQEFTKYSFPSKNMEYLASGTPVLTTRLPGMPSEYLDHVLTIDEPGAAGITKALEKAFAEGRDGLAERGERGRRFVLERKNNVQQAKRILDLASRCAS